MMPRRLSRHHHIERLQCWNSHTNQSTILSSFDFTNCNYNCLKHRSVCDQQSCTFNKSTKVTEQSQIVVFTWLVMMDDRDWIIFPSVAPIISKDSRYQPLRIKRASSHLSLNTGFFWFRVGPQHQVCNGANVSASNQAVVGYSERN